MVIWIWKVPERFITSFYTIDIGKKSYMIYLFTFYCTSLIRIKACMPCSTLYKWPSWRVTDETFYFNSVSFILYKKTFCLEYVYFHYKFVEIFIQYFRFWVSRVYCNGNRFVNNLIWIDPTQNWPKLFYRRLKKWYTIDINL